MFSVPRFSSWWSEGADSKRGNSRETHSLSLPHTQLSLTHSLSLSLSLPHPFSYQAWRNDVSWKSSRKWFRSRLSPTASDVLLQAANSLTNTLLQEKEEDTPPCLALKHTHSRTHTLTPLESNMPFFRRIHQLLHQSVFSHVLWSFQRTPHLSPRAAQDSGANKKVAVAQTNSLFRFRPHGNKFEDEQRKKVSRIFYRLGIWSNFC